MEAMEQEEVEQEHVRAGREGVGKDKKKTSSALSTANELKIV